MALFKDTDVVLHKLWKTNRVLMKCGHAKSQQCCVYFTSNTVVSIAQAITSEFYKADDVNSSVTNQHADQQKGRIMHIRSAAIVHQRMVSLYKMLA